MRSANEMTIIRTRDRIKQSALIDQVGNTPLIPLSNVRGELAKSVEIYVKAEWHNPGGSVKDRPAATIIQHALEGGLLDNSIHLLDSTSGNMGVSYATLTASLGIRVHLTIPANAGKNRLSILRALGAELTLTDPLEGSDGARIVAAEIANQNPGRYFFADQYSNPMNWKSHYLTTGPEILQQTEGRLTHFIAGLGTSGTMMGTGKYLKANADDITLVAIHPDGPLHGLEGLKHMASSPNPEIYDPSLPDTHLQVSTEDAYRMAKRLAKEEGLLVGISAAAAVSAAFQIGAELEYGLIVVLLPDSASKYLDMDFWRDAR